MFEEDVTKEIEEIQQEVRIRRECKPNPDIRHDNFYTTTQHPDSVVTTISCVPVHYRIPQDSIQKIDDFLVSYPVDPTVRPDVLPFVTLGDMAVPYSSLLLGIGKR